MVVLSQRAWVAGAIRKSYLSEVAAIRTGKPPEDAVAPWQRSAPGTAASAVAVSPSSVLAEIGVHVAALIGQVGVAPVPRGDERGALLGGPLDVVDNPVGDGRRRVSEPTPRGGQLPGFDLVVVRQARDPLTQRLAGRVELVVGGIEPAAGVQTRLVAVAVGRRAEADLLAVHETAVGFGQLITETTERAAPALTRCGPRRRDRNESDRDHSRGDSDYS